MTMTTVDRWSGRDVRALREAKRMSLRQFAKRLGISDRMVSKWEAGGDGIHPRPVNQAALDTFLAQSTPEEQARFQLLRSGTTVPTPRADPVEQANSQDDATHVRHPGDGKLMTLVEAGVFLCGPDDKPIWLPAFYIDVYPTTNADYGRFIAATGHRAPMHWTDGRCPEDQPDHPVVFVTWRDAAAYAAWAGKSLPTSQQWEKAARGPLGNTYPWGNAATPPKCNVRENVLRSTTPVDRYHSGTSPYGVYDMCGNVWEWCSSETDPGRYELKGSAFTSSFGRAAPSAFNDASADMYDDDTGFRCATPAEELDKLLRLR